MATYYTFELDGGRMDTHAGPESIINMSDGTTKAASAVQIGDSIAPTYGVTLPVTNITTQEVA